MSFLSEFGPALRWGSAAALAIAATPVCAQTAPAWNVVKSASSVGFSTSVSGAALKGSFRRWSAQIRFDPAALDKSSVVAVIDTKSAVTGDASRDTALPGADWFFTDRFPTATFRASRFKALGGNRYMAFGSLTMRGVTKPANLPFQLVINGKQARMQGSLTLNRAQFGVGQGQFAGFDIVPAAVKVNISIRATRP